MGESAIDIIVTHPVVAAMPYWAEMAKLGVPPHVTLLYPWRASPVDDASLAALRETMRRFEPFMLVLTGIATFQKGVVYAEVEPRPLLRAITGALSDAFTDTPPYGGEFAAAGPTPHCTLAKCAPSDVERVAAAVAGQLRDAFPCSVPVASVAVEQESPDGTWSVTHTFPLGAG